MMPATAILSDLNRIVLEEFYRKGVKPKCLAISRELYRRLIEAACARHTGDAGRIGSRALDQITTPIGSIEIVIDELLADWEVCFA